MPGFLNDDTKHFLQCRSEDLFNEAPTSIYKKSVTNLCRKLEEHIEKKLATIYETRCNLNYGSEFELTLLQRKTLHSALHIRLGDDSETKPNPNLSVRHKKNMDSFLKDVEKELREKKAFEEHKGTKGVIDDKYAVTDILNSKLTKEIRTRIHDGTNDYFQSVEKLASTLTSATKKNDIFTVVYSEHQHISVNKVWGAGGMENCTRDILGNEDMVRRMMDMQIRCLSFILLPEDVAKNASKNHDSNAFKFRAITDTIEFKVNSHSYAHDPHLNHLVRLTIIAAGIDDITGEVGKDSHPKIEKYKILSGMKISYSGADFKEICDISRNDPLLQHYWGKEMVEKLSATVSRYQDISDEKITAQQLKLLNQKKQDGWTSSVQDSKPADISRY